MTSTGAGGGPAISVTGLTKTFGDTHALQGVDLEARQGTVLGVLGPNGAGKTTTVRILATLMQPDAGSAQVAGLDVVTQADELRTRIGLAGQYAAVDEALTGLENLTMVGRLYGENRRTAKIRATDLLDRFSLTDAASKPAKDYSGGMRRRLDLAAALVAKPEVLFLDEPTTGLDPRSRLDLWAVIEELVADGTTVLLTTQYLEEADRLADHIAVIDRGTVIADGTADELKARVGGGRVEVRLTDPEHAGNARHALQKLSDELVTSESALVRVVPRSADGAAVEVLRALDAAGVGVTDVSTTKPSLDDAFLTLTGAPTETTTEKEIAA